MDHHRLNPSGLWRTLDEVLADGDALQVFLSWAKAEGAADPLLFHFSVVAFKEMIKSGDERANKLAHEIHSRYVDPKKGACRFFDRAVCEEVAARLEQPERSRGDALRFVPPFVTSDVFLDFVNSMQEDVLSRPSTSAQPDASAPPPSQSTASTTRRPHRTRRPPAEPLSSAKRLTPAVLLRSQRERERLLGQSSVEKMFQPPIFKYPYVCQANPSKNDSAVSSNFSSEAGSSQHRGFTPAGTLQTNKPPPPPPHRHDRQNVSSADRHDTEEGRRAFAEALTKRLAALDEKISRDERMNERIKRIDGRAMHSARDVVISETALPTHGALDEDEDLDNYVKQRMVVDDSGKPSPSQQSPAPLGQFAGPRRRRRSPKSCSPDPPPPTHVHFNPMTQSCFDQHGGPSARSGGGLLTTKLPGFASMTTASSIVHQERPQNKPKKASHSLATSQRRPQPVDFASLPRQREVVPSGETMKISYRGSDGVPIVAQAPPEAAHLPRIPPLLFNSLEDPQAAHCEDEAAPHQLQLINDDHELSALLQRRDRGRVPLVVRIEAGFFFRINKLRFVLVKGIYARNEQDE
ncbi:hypothetical protein M3Y99_00362700 [Aphelenchoides fujianensis]|nr:hypothetical protein M3Y99_00362700 [Aphelenchoides fujianensis]